MLLTACTYLSQKNATFIMPRGKRSDEASQQNIDDLRKKLNLLEGDRKAYIETATYTVKQNGQKIQQLRKEVQELNQKRADRRAADEEVVAKGLEDHPVERNALRNKPGSEAIRHMDEKCCDLKNKLNKMKYITSKKKRQLSELKTQQEQMEKDHKDAVETAKGESEDAQKMRNLENRLDKANLKCREAEHIQNTYIQIKAKLEQEHSTFNTTLDEMEEAIKQEKAELKELEAMNQDAQLARDAAKEEYERQEKEIYADRQQREKELQAMRKQAEETRIQNEKNERRIAGRAASVQQEEMQSDQRQAIAEEDEQQKITKYEEMFKKIKEATGVSDTQEVVTRFEYQEDTTEQLEDLKAQNEKQISRLREDKEKKQQEFEEMKYTGEAKMSSGQRLLEEFETHLTEEQLRQDATQDKLDKNSRILTDIKTGMDHLAKKLKQVKAPQSQVQKANISPASDEHVLDQMSQCEEKLMKLMEELDASGKGMDDIIKEMEEEEFHNTAESRLPTYNTRVPLQTSHRDIYEVDSDSGDDEAILTRAVLKRQSQMVVDSKNKRRGGGRRRKKNNK